MGRGEGEDGGRDRAAHKIGMWFVMVYNTRCLFIFNVIKLEKAVNDFVRRCQRSNL